MKKLLIAVGVASLLLLLTAQVAPAMAARDLKDITGYTLLDDKFAVRIDMNQKWHDSPNENLIQMTEDLLVPTNPKVLSDGYEDDQEFYMAYVNMDGIQAAYNALLKFEHNVSTSKVLNAFPELWYDQVEGIFEGAADFILGLADNSAYNVGYINATAPFQTLVEHWRTLPDDQGNQAEMFVSNHYVALMAYNTSAEDPFLDSQDTLFLGYTFAFNELTEAINGFIQTKTGEPDFIGDYNAVPFFNEINNGYTFGVEYENLLVVWQEIDLEEFEDCGAIIYGRNIEAITLLDSLKFTYKFTTQELGPSSVDPTITEVWADISTTYDFGETSLLITTESGWPTGFTPTEGSFIETNPTYTFDFPDAIVSLIRDGTGIFTGWSGFPDSVTVNLGLSLAFYLNDDAKKRIAADEEGYGMIMTTMTNIFAVGLATDPTHAAPDAVTDGLVNDTIDILANGEEVFRTTFTNKLEYELNETVPDIDGTYEVRVKYWEKAHATNLGLGWFYFDLEMALAWIFLNVIAKEMGLTDGHHVVDVDHSAYFTLTQYWRWNGGVINHDPTYTAISGKAGESTETDTASSDGAFTPGFEFLVVALAIIPLAAYKKRR